MECKRLGLLDKILEESDMEAVEVFFHFRLHFAAFIWVAFSNIGKKIVSSACWVIFKKISVHLSRQWNPSG